MKFDHVRTRFAPSPTGYMHVGNLRTALYAYLTAKSMGGKMILRIEDTDQERQVEGAVDIIYNTMRDTGLLWDEGPDIGGPVGPYVQSERMGIYKEYALKLVELGAAYYCFCDKERLEEVRELQKASGIAPQYDRHCRNLTPEEVQAKLDAGEPYVIRQKVPLEGTTTFDDVVYGLSLIHIFSVLTPVGLLPIAAAGHDIRALMEGARTAQRLYDEPDHDLLLNPAYRYAAIQDILSRKGKSVELFGAYEPFASGLSQWLIQLYGESCGKDGKGLFPASAQFSTDLHSLGQYIQEGQRILCETVLDFADTGCGLTVPVLGSDHDGLGYLEGRSLSEINRIALMATAEAHWNGGVPVTLVTAPRRDAQTLGELFYFFELSCAVSGYLLGINPFDQPGVEQYKRNMFRLLGKPGYTGTEAK